MTNLNFESSTAANRALAHLLHLVALIFVASAALIIFVVMPYVLLGHWRMLPHWNALVLIVILFPIVIAWGHAGIYMVFVVVICEGIALKLKTPTHKEKVEAVLKVAVCVLAYLILWFGFRYNFH